MRIAFLDTQENRIDFGLVTIRMMFGVIFIFHGSQKLFGAFGGHGVEGMAMFLQSMSFPLPYLNAWMAALTEFIGGVLLILGFASRISSLLLSFTMIVASFTAHAGSFDIQKGGMEYPLSLSVILIALAFMGSGRYSLSRKW